MPIQHITPIELKAQLEKGAKFFLLDVREQEEYDFTCLDNSVLIPFNDLVHYLHAIDHAKPIVTICHHGMRSLMAANFLAQVGFNPVFNLTGGIDAWSLECDSSLPRY